MKLSSAVVIISLILLEHGKMLVGTNIILVTP